MFQKRGRTLSPSTRTTPRLVVIGVSVAGTLAVLTSCSGGARDDRPVIGVVQVAALRPLDEAREGFYKALADSGFVRDVNVTFIERNAQGDVPTLALIMREFLQENVTQVATMSSIATQTAMKVITDRPIVFGAVANPYVIGAGTSRTAHRPNVTGAEIPFPVDSALSAAVSIFPDARVWGTLFDPSDPFAEHYVGVARRKAAQLGVRFLTVACTSPQDIATGVQALRAQGARGIMQIPSIMIEGGFSALIKQARELGMVLVGSNTGTAGAPIALGPRFYDNGYAQGLMMIRVLRGESPANIPFRVAANAEMVVDLPSAADFGITIPAEVIKAASRVIPLERGGDTVGVAPIRPSTRPAGTNREASPWEFWLAALVLGLAFTALAWGVYIASRVLRFPDITPDGSFPLGAAVAATLIVGGVDPFVASGVAFLAGMAAGYVTGVLHTRLKVNELLAGILVMTALYSVNLHVMGRSNISLLDRETVATQLNTIIPATAAWPSDFAFGVVFLALTLVLGLAFTWFLRTDFGTAMRAAGDNPTMIIAQGVDRRTMVELALALGNGLVAFSGALVAQYQGFADVTMGVGTLVAGMAAVILGETLKPRRWRLGATIAMVAVGAIFFRGLIAVALRIGLDPIDLKLATAAFVLATLALPNLKWGKRRAGAVR
jgi:putative tryptophan/tyrosine transport system permease protein